MDPSSLYVPLADQATNTLVLCQSRYLRALCAERHGIQPAEDAPLAAIAQYIHGEHMLSDPGGGQDNLLGLLLRPDAFAGTLGDLLLESSLQRGCSR